MAAASAQDKRSVTEPVIPPSCFVLVAKLAAVEGNKTLAEGDESRPDTLRMQKALDACPKGEAVELQADGARNAFLSGPLDLRAGVTLVVNSESHSFKFRTTRASQLVLVRYTPDVPNSITCGAISPARLVIVTYHSPAQSGAAGSDGEPIGVEFMKPDGN